MLQLDLHYWPARAPADLVPSELLVGIRIPNRGIDIVVDQDPPIHRIIVDALAARSTIMSAFIIRSCRSYDSCSLTHTRYHETPGQWCRLQKDKTCPTHQPASCELTIRKCRIGQLTKLPVALLDRQTLILYSAPLAGLVVSYPQQIPAEKNK